MANARIQVRICGHEFTAEGPAEMVKEQYAQFLAKLPDQGQSECKTNLSKVDIARAFTFNSDGTLQARVEFVPGGDHIVREAQQLMLYMYGNLAINGISETPAGNLIAVLKHGYLRTDIRVDRALASVSAYVEKTGAKRGSKYKLTQQGITYVEAMIMRFQKR